LFCLVVTVVRQISPRPLILLQFPAELADALSGPKPQLGKLGLCFAVVTDSGVSFE
jgi:hypothetical protein